VHHLTARCDHILLHVLRMVARMGRLLLLLLLLQQSCCCRLVELGQSLLLLLLLNCGEAATA